MHTLVDDRATRIVISKFQYLGVAPIGVLWLLFTTQYSRIDMAGASASLRVAGVDRARSRRWCWS